MRSVPRTDQAQVEPGLPVRGDGHGIPLLPQQLAEHAGQVPVVLDEEDVGHRSEVGHGASVPVRTHNFLRCAQNHGWGDPHPDPRPADRPPLGATVRSTACAPGPDLVAGRLDRRLLGRAALRRRPLGGRWRRPGPGLARRAPWTRHGSAHRPDRLGAAARPGLPHGPHPVVRAGLGSGPAGPHPSARGVHLVQPAVGAHRPHHPRATPRAAPAGLWGTIVDFTVNYPGMLLAIAGTVALCMVVVTSVKRGSPSTALRVVAPHPPLRLPRRRARAAPPAVDGHRLHREPHRDRLLVDPVCRVPGRRPRLPGRRPAVQDGSPPAARPRRPCTRHPGSPP